MTEYDLKDSKNSTIFIDNQIFNCRDKAINIPDNLNKIRTLFVIDINDATPDYIQMLDSIAKACKLEKENYHISNEGFKWSSIKHLNNIKEIILFGNLEDQLKININLPIHYNYKFDDRIWIKTVACNVLFSNKEAKTALWNQALKPHYTTN